tara:strand:- start:2861 stop:3307 length:447 start_codon:yes stop_codon:yes gene_type:complete
MPWDNWDVNELVSQTTQEGLMGETGLLEGWGETEVNTWIQDYGGYITPYDPTQEQMVGKSFIDEMNQKFSETYQKFDIASKMSGRSGFGTSYSASNLTQDVLQNAGASMAAARTKKDQLIYGAREDWVSELYDMFEYLGTMGAFEDEG